ncbi:MAG TPA: M20/M25/M40 family metallo-hydrolase [Bryobacteraceae bacterium]|nr:M20/M25/M40 family metallo-hydrolase [Bryobacteraceae bacterium]
MPTSRLRKQFLLLVFLLPAAWAQPKLDLGVITRIKTEAYDHSKVMDHLSWLSDVYGPRLTASPEFFQAAEWAAGRLREIGLSNVHLEPWGPFGRKWSAEEWSLEMIEPRYAVLDATPLAWSAGTNGAITGETILAPLKRTFDPKKAREEFEAYRKQWAGKLRGKFVMLRDPKIPPEQTKPQFRRYTDAELADIAKAPEHVAKNYAKLADLKFPEDPEELGKFFASLPESTFDELFDAAIELATERNRFFLDEGVLGLLMRDDRSHGGLANAEQAGSHKSADPLAPPTFVITAEQYNRMARVMEKKMPVRVRVSLKVQASEADVNSANIVAEIPGGTKKDEVVMVGAHYDSWHAGTGATDNGAGSAVMIEVMRILKTLNLSMDRTVRIALWSGEEQGLYGSEAYVKQHFADPKTMKLLPEHAKLSGYFNLDNGSGKIRGVYLQENDAMRPLFEAWLAPFRDEGATTITIHNTGGTDHLSFDAVGLPGFQFIQDPLDYGSVTHHSNMDTYDHAVASDLMEDAAVIAAVVYDAANSPEMLPRQELPKPQK